MDGDQLVDPLAVSDDPLATAPEDAPIEKDKIYWALWKGKDLVSAIAEQTQHWYESARNRGLFDRWIVAYAFHHGATPEDLREMATQMVSFTGSELERVRFHINLARSYARHTAIMALGEKPAFKCKTVNSDHQSIAKAELSDKIINGLYQRYYEVYDPIVAEGDSFAGACGAHTRWDFKTGDQVTVDKPVMAAKVDPETGVPMLDDQGEALTEPAVGEDGHPITQPKQVVSGSPYVTVVYPWNAPGETRSSGPELWRIIRETESKWNLIGMFGEVFRDDILRQNTKLDEYDFATIFRLEEIEFESKDLICVQHFYHARCAAIPEGRYVVLCGDVILWDGPCPTREGIPYAEMKSSTFVETTFPYCDGWDVISLNQALNQCTSDELQNISLFARQSTYSYKGSNITANGLTGGSHYELPQGSEKPGALMLAAMPPTEEFKNYVLQMADRVVGQNGTTRGEPDANVRSGEMAALLDSISIRYQSFKQQSARRYRVRNAQIILDMISRYGETKFLVDIAGVQERGYVHEFTKDDISGIQRVDVDVVSPMMQTVSGRLQWAQQLMDPKVQPQERAALYDFVITGDADQLLGRNRSAAMLVRRENERLILGNAEVSVNATDDPWKHVPGHTAELERMQASDEPDLEAISRFRDHILQHWSVYVMYAQPVICNFLGIQPPPAIGPSASSPTGNAAFQFQMQLAAGMPLAPTPQVPGDAANTGNAPANTGNPAANTGNPAANGTPQTASSPTGTPMPQPSQPPPTPDPSSLQ